MVLVCQQRALGALMHGEITYKIRSKFDVGDMEVLEGHTTDVHHTFFIRNEQRSIALYAE